MTTKGLRSFEWALHDSALVTHICRSLDAAAGSYHLSLSENQWLIKGEAPSATVTDCLAFMDLWEEHKPEVVSYSYGRQDAAVFQKALAHIFPHKVVTKPFFGRKATMKLYGARSEHRRFQERLLEEQVEEVFHPFL